MAIFHRCDRCGKEISTEEINTPFIRHDLHNKIAVSLLAVDDRGKPAEDVCTACKLDIINNGTPAKTLQLPHDVARPTAAPAPVVSVMAPPEVAPVYEPSAPAARTAAQIVEGFSAE